MFKKTMGTKTDPEPKIVFWLLSFFAGTQK